MCVRGDSVSEWGWGQEAVFQGMELRYKKFDIKKHEVFKRGCVRRVVLRWKVFDQSKLDFFVPPG